MSENRNIYLKMSDYLQLSARIYWVWRHVAVRMGGTREESNLSLSSGKKKE